MSYKPSKLCWEQNTYFICVQSPRRIFVIVFNEGNFIPILWLQQKPWKAIVFCRVSFQPVYEFLNF